MKETSQTIQRKLNEVELICWSERCAATILKGISHRTWTQVALPVLVADCRPCTYSLFTPVMTQCGYRHNHSNYSMSKIDCNAYSAVFQILLLDIHTHTVICVRQPTKPNKLTRKRTTDFNSKTAEVGILASNR